VDPVPDPMLLRKSGRAGNGTRNLWVSRQELWPLDHRGVYIYIYITAGGGGCARNVLSDFSEKGVTRCKTFIWNFHENIVSTNYNFLPYVSVNSLTGARGCAVG
jgi:hypothetical protein